jgi:formylglycine-generating enzyme required for sulfatase activity
MPRLCSTLLLSLLLASSASAVTMDWTFVGDSGNACDQQSQGCFGAVGYAYSIGTYEVTKAQYTEFLNAVAKADPGGLYHVSMDSNFGGITRNGSPGSYTYSAIAGRGDIPVSSVSVYDALRFANWLQNGQPTGSQDASTTEGGAYTITAAGISNNSITRNAGAQIFLPSENEWYKAAYYDASSSSYFDYPAGSNTQTTCAAPTATANSANCNHSVGDYTNAGSYTGSASPYGTFDQGGNAWEFTETIVSGSLRKNRGGSALSDQPQYLSAAFYDSVDPSVDYVSGFRMASAIPEPDTGLLVIAGLLGLGGWRRARD